MSTRRTVLRVVISYLVLATLWILFSDMALAQLASNTEQLTRLQTYKGLFFIAITSLFLYFLLHREIARDQARFEQAQRQYHLASVGQLAAGIAHDFNNILTTMMGTAQLLELDVDPSSKTRKDLTLIYSQGQRAAQLIRQILDFSRQTVAERRPMDLVPFLKETLKLMERTLPEHVQIQSEFRTDTCSVEANLTQLQQILTNLAVNARDAMPEGGTLYVTIETRSLHAAEFPFPDMKPGRWAIWAVSDTGQGISPEVLQHIFEPFYTTKPRGEGTGLGLAQVYGIVKQHHGFIDVQSQVNKGTTFSIYMPLSDATPLADEEASDTLPAGTGKRLLIVEDKPDVLAIVYAMVKKLGYEPLTATNGREALDILSKHPDGIDLVISDMVMPEMGGVALFEALQENRPEIPVVLMSGYAPEESSSTRLPSEIAGFLEKPISLQRLALTLGQALKQ